MAVKTKHTFSAANGSTAAFSGHGIELNNLDDLDVYVTLSGGTRRLSLRQSTDTTATSSHPQVNNTDGLYFPAVSVGDQLYNYQLSTANDTITFNNNLPNLAVVTVERRTRDGSGDYTTFAGGSTVRHTDLNRSATESNYTAQEARNKVFEIEGKLFGDAVKDSSFITSADIVDGTIVAADLASNAVTTAKIQDDAVTSDKLNNTGVSAGSYTLPAITVDAQGRLTSASNGSISSSNIAADAIDSTKLADNAVNSEHYVDGSIDAVHLATDSVTAAKIEANAVGSSELATNAVTTVKVAADAINGDKIADDSINSEHYVDGSIDTAHIGNNQITSGKLADDSVVTAKIADNNVTLAKLGSGALPTDITVNADNLVANSVGTSEIAADAINGTKIADNAIGSEHIAANAVTTSELADAELTTLAGMQSGTASILASSTALTSTTTELNLLDGKSVTTAVSGSSTDSQLPTAKAVNDAITNISDAGNFVPIANEVSFPNSNPDPGNNAGTIVSIADAGGIVVNGSGVSTTGRTLGGATVTINGIDSSLNSTTIAAGKGMLVQTTTTTNTYDYHRLVVDEAGVASAQTLVSDFNNRYRIGSSNPSTSLDDGDLFFNTTSNKMLVYNDTDSSWDEVQSVGNYFINTISSYSGTGGNNATFNGTAYRFVLSNAGAKAEQHLVSINGVIQKPNSGTSQPSEGFAIDGSSIIFSNAPATGSDYFIVTIGSSVNIGTPSNNTVSTAALQNLAVTGDKIANDTITEVKLDVHQAPSDGKFLKYTSSNGMEWGDVPAGVGGGTGVDFNDSVKARFGTGNDLEIFHDGSDSRIKDVGTGYLKLTTNTLVVENSGSNADLLRATESGSVDLFYDGSKKFETFAAGFRLCNNSALTMNSDSSSIYFGADDDMQIWHNGTSGNIKNKTGDLNIYATNTDTGIKVIADAAVELYFDNEKMFQTNSDGAEFFDSDNNFNLYFTCNGTRRGYLFVDATNGGKMAFMDDQNHPLLEGIKNSAVNLYYDNSKKFETTSTGVSVSGQLSASDNIDIPVDSTALRIGAGNDLQIYHDGSNSYIDDVGTGGLKLRTAGSATTGFYKYSNPEEKLAEFEPDESCRLYYDNSKKFETYSAGTHTHGQFKASSDGNWADSGGGAFHEFNGSGVNGYELLVKNNSANPASHYIQEIKFTAAAPDDASAQFLDCRDSGSARYRIYSNGDTWSSDGGVVNSDRTLKENIVDATSKLEDLKKLKVRNFNFKSEVHPNSNNKRLGFIAQEVEEVFPGLVNEYRFNAKEEETPVMKKAIKDAWAPILVKALQEAITKIETLETKVAALEAK